MDTNNETRRDWRWDEDGELDAQYLELREVPVRNGPSAGQTKLVFDFEALEGETVSVWENAVLRSKFAAELRARRKPDFEPGERITITPLGYKDSPNGKYRDFAVTFEHAAPKRTAVEPSGSPSMGDGENAAAGEMLAAALDYASRGWLVLPLHDVARGVCSCRDAARCDTPGKHPRIREWRKRATIDLGTILSWWQRWPTAGVGILTGQPSGLVVLDVDPRHGGDDALWALEQQHGPLSVTVEVVTGGGGRHIYFAHQSPLESFTLAPGLEVKADGTFVVAPPSRTGERA
jgi:hypothetical protein